MVFVAGAVVVLAVDTAMKWLVFGNPVPLPFFAKQHGAYQGCGEAAGRNPFELMRVFLAATAPFVVMLVFFVRRQTAAAMVAMFVPVAITFAYYFTVDQIMGQAGRFYVPSLAFFVVGAAIAVDAQLRHGRPHGAIVPGELLRRLVCTVFVLAVAEQLLVHWAAWYNRRLPAVPEVTGVRPYRVAAREPLPVPDRWESTMAIAEIARRAPEGTVIALSEHGLVGARAPRAVLIDLVGLHDPAFARRGFSATALLGRKPDLIWLPHYNYPRLLQDILIQDAFWQEYAFYPGAFHLGIALRRDSPRLGALRALVEEQWTAVYGDRSLADYLAVPAR